MALQKNTRSITFRITEEEYAILRMLAARVDRRKSVTSIAKDLMMAGIDALTAEESAMYSPSPAAGGWEPFAELTQGQDGLRRRIDALAYVMLYHLSPVADGSKSEAERSAWKRFRKYTDIAKKIDEQAME